MKLPATFRRFCLVGGIGFLADAILLELGVAAGLDAAVARVFSMLAALQLTYALHRAYTFRSTGRNAGSSTGARGVRRWMLFLAVNLFGGAVNYGVFLLALAVWVTPDPRLARMVALCLGTGVALAVNYSMNRLIVFREAG